MPAGMWIDDGWVQVKYENESDIPVTTAYYLERGYQPPLADLPTKAEYDIFAAGVSFGDSE